MIVAASQRLPERRLQLKTLISLIPAWFMRTAPRALAPCGDAAPSVPKAILTPALYVLAALPCITSPASTAVFPERSNNTARVVAPAREATRHDFAPSSSHRGGNTRCSSTLKNLRENATYKLVQHLHRNPASYAKHETARNKDALCFADFLSYSPPARSRSSSRPTTINSFGDGLRNIGDD